MSPRRSVSFALACMLAVRTHGQAEQAGGEDPAGTACRPCHAADRPADGDAALATCARVVPRGTHVAAEGPGAIVMNEKAEHYGRVVFQHKMHAEMSETGGGCSECHHEATEGRPMRKCSECHSPVRLRTDLEKPDLRGAIHRLCVACHQQWDAASRCGTCHAGGSGAEEATAPRAARTAFAGGILYKFHKSMACSSCHKAAGAFGKVELSCESCHAGWQKAFDHSKTGLALDDTHREASCKDCHGARTLTEPPACTSCHDDKTYPADKPGKPVKTPMAPARRAPQ